MAFTQNHKATTPLPLPLENQLLLNLDKSTLLANFQLLSNLVPDTLTRHWWMNCKTP